MAEEEQRELERGFFFLYPYKLSLLLKNKIK